MISATLALNLFQYFYYILYVDNFKRSIYILSNVFNLAFILNTFFDAKNIFLLSAPFIARLLLQQAEVKILSLIDEYLFIERDIVFAQEGKTNLIMGAYIREIIS